MDLKKTNKSRSSIEREIYGRLPDGRTVDQYTLSNDSGMAIQVISYGGIITSWVAPDKWGNNKNIALGFETLEQYIEKNPYFGALIGRYGNRIAHGKFSLDGHEFQLETNNGPNHLHGGSLGFDKVLWTISEEKVEDGVAVKLTYISEDGEGGYPGTLNASVIYNLTNDNALEVTYAATTDKTTIVNLTQHTYFNLSGDFSETILDHELVIQADSFLPVDETLIPTGDFRSVAQTPFDFRSAKTIGQDIEMEDDQLLKGAGYDHCWVLNGSGMRQVSSVYHPDSGRLLEVFTDEPGIQFYCGNFLDGRLDKPGGGTYLHRTGFCLEAQHYPDSPNQDHFPSTVLKPGEKYSSKTIFKFSVK